jgi:hypothetical protein
VALAGCTRVPSDIVVSWYPLGPGNTWVYQNEALEGDMAHPDFERWTTEVTIVSAVPFPELDGTLVTRRTKAFGDTLSPDYLQGNNMAKREEPETHLLIHGSCVYVLDGWDATCAQFNDEECAPAFGPSHRVRREYRDELLRGNVPPGFCFPMGKGSTWGRVPSTGGSDLYVWTVLSLNTDPFGPPESKTYRMWSTTGGGEEILRWFTEGVGVVQLVDEHHGTYDELRRQLVKATIRGKTRSYQLTPARQEPGGEDDCSPPGWWQHFVRADGSPFKSEAECLSYASKEK